MVRLIDKKVLSLLVLTSFTGCTGLNKDEGTYRIETVESKTARVGRVVVDRVTNGLSISGMVSRRWSQRGPIRGHVDLYIEDGNEVLSVAEGVRYRRQSIKSRTAWFRISIDARPPPGSVIRLVHDDSGPTHGT